MGEARREASLPRRGKQGRILLSGYAARVLQKPAAKVKKRITLIELPAQSRDDFNCEWLVKLTQRLQLLCLVTVVC